MRTLFTSLALLLSLLSAPTYAFHCPVDMAAIDAALKQKAQTLSADVFGGSEKAARGRRSVA